MLAASEPQLAAALLLLSYPLHPPKQPAKLRTEHLPSLRISAMVVHGVRDEFATNEEMESALALIPARTELLNIPSAGHELLTRTNRDLLLDQITSRFLAFTGTTA